MLVAFELNHFIRTNVRTKHKYMTLKLDVSKVYDRVEWIFLQKVLLRRELPHRFVDLIMLSITSVSYSYLMIGLQFGQLAPERGLRQGDPLSPYLFICVVEAFIRVVDVAARQGIIRGIQIAQSTPHITSMCFADDTMVILKVYARVSGQVINFEKSSGFWSGN